MWPFRRTFVVQGEVIPDPVCRYAIRRDDGTILKSEIARTFRVDHGQHVAATCIRGSGLYDVSVRQLQVAGEDAVPQRLGPPPRWGRNRWHSVSGLLTTDGEGDFYIAAGWNRYCTVTLRPDQHLLLHRLVRVRGPKLGPAHIAAEEITLVG